MSVYKDAVCHSYVAQILRPLLFFFLSTLHPTLQGLTCTGLVVWGDARRLGPWHANKDDDQHGTSEH